MRTVNIGASAAAPTAPRLLPPRSKKDRLVRANKLGVNAFAVTADPMSLLHRSQDCRPVSRDKTGASADAPTVLRLRFKFRRPVMSAKLCASAAAPA